MAYRNYSTTRGFSLIEVLVVAAILLLFFTGLFGSLRYTLALVSDSKAKLTALTVANDQMEYIRSLSYDAVGTVAGIPAGLIPQVSTSSLNTIEFQTRVLIEYIDDAADGIGAADSNGITTDYKQAKVSVTWSSKGVAREVFLVSNIIPRSIETSVGGGTLRVNVFDADVMALPGASVRVVNNTLSPAIDVTRFTDAAGAALFGGAPAGPDYEIFVTAPGYSSDQTYFATTTLPSPTTQPVAVLEADVSTVNFFIDELSEVTLKMYANKTEGAVIESFADSSGISSSSAVVVGGGELELQNTAGVYVSSGAAFLQPIEPSPLEEWNTVTVVGSQPSGTTALVQFYVGSSTTDLVPDTELAGNSTGFSLGTVDISYISASLYPSLTIGISLTTGITSVSPSIDTITLSYIESASVASGIPVTMTGAKTIGSNGSVPVYKTTFSETTDGVGEIYIPEVEWDAYTIAVSGYDIAQACPANPLIVDPGEETEGEVVLVGDSAHTQRVVVETVDGVLLPGALVTLSRLGFSEAQVTSSCGQVFFSGLTNALDYTLTVEVDGYATQVLSDQNVENDVVTVVQF